MTGCRRKLPASLRHYTPLRYPGGKAKLAPYVKRLIVENGLLDGEYVEPYAGGAGIALELLFHEYVSRIHINDLSNPIYAFWHSVLNRTEELCRLVRDTPVSLASWDKQRRVFSSRDGVDLLVLGFAAFFLNRTNRSGILNGGVIGGRSQAGRWGIDARFNRAELVYRIESIAKMKRRIVLTRLDAMELLKTGLASWPERTLIYLDPPYYSKGRDLYYDFYEHRDHAGLAEFVTSRMKRCRWIVSYDDVPPIRSLYRGSQRVFYRIGYSARTARKGSEVMFFSPALRTSRVVGGAMFAQRA